MKEKVKINLAWRSAHSDGLQSFVTDLFDAMAADYGINLMVPGSLLSLGGTSKTEWHAYLEHGEGAVLFCKWLQDVKGITATPFQVPEVLQDHQRPFSRGFEFSSCKELTGALIQC